VNEFTGSGLWLGVCSFTSPIVRVLGLPEILSDVAQPLCELRVPIRLAKENRSRSFPL
jgi:hypothetical protein